MKINFLFAQYKVHFMFDKFYYIYAENKVDFHFFI